VTRFHHHCTDSNSSFILFLLSLPFQPKNNQTLQTMNQQQQHHRRFRLPRSPRCFSNVRLSSSNTTVVTAVFVLLLSVSTSLFPSMTTTPASSSSSSLTKSILFVLAEDDPTTCVFSVEADSDTGVDGGEEEVEFNIGEPVGNIFETRCGSYEDYPCFCAPTLQRQVYCPYCGFVNETGDLHCAADGETIIFPDGSIERVCSCQFIEDDPGADPIRNCTVAGGGALDPQCVLADEEGNDVVFQQFDPILFFPGACGEPEQWPTFCLGTDDQGGILFEYPYCVFANTQDGDTICSVNNGTVSYIDDTGEGLTCTCTYTTEDGPQTDCVRAVVPLPSGPTDVPAPSPAPVTPPPSTANVIRMDWCFLVMLWSKWVLLS
jgi:hypothetical protein